LVGFGDSCVFIPVYRFSRHRTGNGDLGFYFRDFSEPSPRIRTGIRKFYALGFGSDNSVLIPTLFSTIGAGTVFLVFTIAMVFQLLFVIFMMPETKGVSLKN
jgi:hypothetical protein